VALKPVMQPDHKQAAVEQWTADPCEARSADGEPGTPEYFEHLLEARDAYGMWFHEELDYVGTRGLDVLDVGCGQGIDLARYAQAGANATGVDLTPRHVELARRHMDALGLEARIVLGDAERLPFDDASFHRASSNGVLHHTPDMPAALRELLRVLRPGGEARIVLYNKRSLHYLLQQVLYEGIWKRALLEERTMAGVLSRGVEYSSIGARPLVRVYSPRRARRELAQAGFVHVTSGVRHFKAGDAFLTAILEPRVPALRNPAVLDRIGRAAGWYVIARGRRPGS
jgi:ubiquinone/menaquinone biosynthesis C-methylase UbiE